MTKHVVEMSYGDRHVEWQWDATDGKTGAVLINGVRYDSAVAGAVFLVSTAGGQVRVDVIKRDLSQLKPDTESVKSFARNDPDVTRFLAQVAKSEERP